MTHLEELKAAIVAACPEKEWVHEVELDDGDYTEMNEPIRLSDVLRAILNKNPANRTLITLESSGQFVQTTFHAGMEERALMPTWDTSHDSLDDQSQAFIDFLHGIICT